MNPLDSHATSVRLRAALASTAGNGQPGLALVHSGSQRPLLLPVGRKVSGPADFAHRPGLSAARRPFMPPRQSKRTIFYILLCCFRNSLHDAARFL